MRRSLYEKRCAVSFLSHLPSLPPLITKETKEDNPFYHNERALDLHAAGVITRAELERLLIDPQELTHRCAPHTAVGIIRKWKEEYEADPEVRWHAVFPPLPAAR